MKNNASDASKKFRESQRAVPYKIEHSWSGSCEYYPDGTREGYRSDGLTRKKNGDMERSSIIT